MPQFELYERRHSGSRRSDKATVTIQRRGVISFSEPAFEALGSPQAVAFLYAKPENLIAFRASRKSEQNSHTIRSASDGSHVAAAHAFVRFLGLDLSESRRYPLVSQDGTHYVDLNEPGTVVTSNRAHSRTRPQPPSGSGPAGGSSGS
jgi:hypothetical protein